MALPSNYSPLNGFPSVLGSLPSFLQFTISNKHVSETALKSSTAIALTKGEPVSPFSGPALKP